MTHGPHQTTPQLSLLGPTPHEHAWLLSLTLGPARAASAALPRHSSPPLPMPQCLCTGSLVVGGAGMGREAAKLWSCRTFSTLPDTGASQAPSWAQFGSAVRLPHGLPAFHTPGAGCHLLQHCSSSQSPVDVHPRRRATCTLGPLPHAWESCIEFWALISAVLSSGWCGLFWGSEPADEQGISILLSLGF